MQERRHYINLLLPSDAIYDGVIELGPYYFR